MLSGHLQTNGVHVSLLRLSNPKAFREVFQTKAFRGVFQTSKNCLQKNFHVEGFDQMLDLAMSVRARLCRGELSRTEILVKTLPSPPPSSLFFFFPSVSLSLLKFYNNNNVFFCAITLSEHKAHYMKQNL